MITVPNTKLLLTVTQLKITIGPLGLGPLWNIALLTLVKFYTYNCTLNQRNYGFYLNYEFFPPNLFK